MTISTIQDKRLFRQQCHIGGEWLDADDGGTLEVTNPATGETLGTVPAMGVAETENAITAAERAFGDWRGRTAAERGAILYKWNELMLAHQEDLARLMTLEQGKPLAESRGEIAYAASFILWFAEEARRAYGDTIPALLRMFVIRNRI